MSLIQNTIPEWVIQATAVAAFLAPLLFSFVNLNRRSGGRLLGLFSPGSERRWRLEFYSADGPVDNLLVAESDMPFPVERVQPSSETSTKHRGLSLDTWTRPQLEMDVTAIDPWAEEILQGIFASPRVRFVSGDEAMVDVAREGSRSAAAVRIRAIAHRE